jgi:putative ABC transport system permease protein
MRLLLLAVALAVAALTAVSFFANRIERGLTRDAAQLLGGDVVVVADQPIEPAWIEEAHRQGLRTSRTWVFPSMARAPDERGGESRLVALKAVDEAYPLRGRMTIATADAQGRVGEPRPAPAGGPPVGELWVDPNVLDGLGVQLGDALWMGEVALRVTAVIVSEPDRGAGFVNFSPRVMMNQADLARTELIQPASRVTYRVLVASAARASDATRDARTGPANETNDADRATEPTGAEPAKPVTGSDAAVQAYTRWVQAQAEATRGARVETLEQGQPQMRTTLDRASLFLRLVALLAALLSAVAVAVVARDFAMRRLDDCALLRVFGVPQSFMAKAYALQFLGVGVMASVLGSLLGWAFHLVFVWLLGNLVSVSLPAAGLAPWLLGLSVGVLLTLGFGLPSVLQLAQVPPLRVLRRDLGEPRAASWTVAGLGLLALIGLLLSVAGDLLLGGIALGGFAVAVGVFALAGWGLARGLGRWARARAGRWPAWLSLSVRQLTAQTGQTVVQVAALGVGLLALMLLVLIRTDLVDSWRAATPQDAPDRFVINIQPDQVELFQARLREAGVSAYDWYPMTRARLVAINGQAVKGERFHEDRARRLIEREFNLSFAAQSSVHNPVVAGRYDAGGEQGFSVEEGLMQTLGLQMGDRLRFEMAGVLHEGRITSVRRVDWASMRVNFFVMAPSAQMPTWPVTYITAFRVPAGVNLDRTLVHDFPNVTVIDVSSTLAQVQNVMNQVISAVEFLFAFTLAAGLVVLVAGMTSSRERRARDWAILRSLGATHALMAKVQRTELLVLGGLAGVLAGAASLAIAWALAEFVFEFSWQAPWWWPLPGALVGAALAWSAGWWTLRGVSRRPVVMTLRQVE